MGSWTPTADDIHTFAINDAESYYMIQSVRSRDDATDVAAYIIKRYNKLQEKFEARQYDGQVADLADIIWAERIGG